MERKRFLLRLPVELHEELRALAEQEMRSLNGQIEYLLRGALRKQRRRKDPGSLGNVAEGQEPGRQKLADEYPASEDDGA